MSIGKRLSGMLVLLGMTGLTGCAHHQAGLSAHHGDACVCGEADCDECVTTHKKHGKLRGHKDCCEADPCGACDHCCGGHLAALEWKLCGWMWKKSNAIPDTLPLGSTVRAHDQVMQTNAEGADFIFYRHEFVGQTAELTPDGKDHLLEVAARMRSAPFPVIIEREQNNSDPELDAHRRNLVATILTDLGNPDAQQRTVVTTAYGPGYTSRRGEIMYYQHIYGNSGNFGNFNGGGGFGGGGGGFGGGGFF